MTLSVPSFIVAKYKRPENEQGTDYDIHDGAGAAGTLTALPPMNIEDEGFLLKFKREPAHKPVQLVQQLVV